MTLRQRNVRRCDTIPESPIHTPTHACAHTHAQRASERARREREREREGGERKSERARERARAPFFKCVLLITLLAPGKHTPTYPASSAPDTRCRRALPKPCNVGPDAAAPPPRPRRHRAHPNARHPRPPDPGPRTPPLQRRRSSSRHRTVPHPGAWVARASTKQSTPGPRPLNLSLSGANRSPGRRRPVGTP